MEVVVTDEGWGKWRGSKVVDWWQDRNHKQLESDDCCLGHQTTFSGTKSNRLKVQRFSTRTVGQ